MKKTAFFILGFLVLVVGGCKETTKDKADEIAIRQDPRKDFSMTRTHEDTVAVMDMANRFLQSLKENDVEGALDQLYEIKDHNPIPLTAEHRNELKKSIGAFPVESFTIDAIILYSDSDSEVRYTTQMFPDSIAKQRPGSGAMKGSLQPYRIDNQWYLTIMPEKYE